MTFSSQSSLERRTGARGLGRFQYLQTLVTEFQDTHKAEYRLQVLANLANFAYDPINYNHFRKLNILDLFLDVIAEDTDETAIEFAIGGVCNCCLDKLNKQYLVDNDGVELTIKCLSTGNEETVLSAITTLMYLVTPQTKKAITADSVLELMQRFSKSSNKRLSNLATVFLEDYCNNSRPATDQLPSPSKKAKLY